MPSSPREGPPGRLRDRLAYLFTPSGFRGPVLTLMTGAGGALVLSYLAQLVLVRLFDPAEFGVSDYFVTVLTVLITFAGLRYEDAIMLPEDDRQAAGLLGLSLALVLATAALLVAVLPWRDALAAWLEVPDLAPWMWLVPVTLVLMRVARLSELWLTRFRDYRPLSAAQVAGTATMQGGRIAAGAAGAGVGGLVGGFAAAQAVTAAMYAVRLARRHAAALGAAFDASAWVRLARRYRRFPFFSMPSAFLGSLVARMPVLLLPVFFDITTLGLYGRALMALYIPLSLVGNAVAQVFFVEAADAHRAGTLATLTRGVHARLVMVCLFPTLVLLAAGPDLFEVVFGDVWRPAGRYVQALGPWLLLMGITSPLTRLFDVLERQRLELGIGVALFVVQLAALLVGGATGDVMTTLVLLGVVGAVARAVQLGLLLRLAGVPLRGALAPYARYGLGALPFLAPIALALLAGRPWVTAAVAVAAGAGYAAVVIRREGLLAPRT